MINTVIFDMDGVIVDSERHWKPIEKEFLESIVPVPYDKFQKDIVGMSVSDLYSLLNSRYGVSMKMSEFLSSYDRIAIRIYKDSVNLIPNVMDFIKNLKNEGCTLTLASSSPRLWISLVLKRFELAQYFEEVLSAEEIGCRGKPAPDIYLYTLEQLKKEPLECLVIEDSENGVISAKEAGLKCVGLRNGFNDDQDLSNSDIQIHNFNELSFDVIKRL